jgi:hypothetical protein
MGGMIQGIGTAALGSEQAADEMRSAIRQGEYDSAAADYNSRQALIKGARGAAKARMEGSALIARQRTAYATSGVETTSGTPMAVMASTAGLSELEAQTIQNDAAREAWGYQVSRNASQDNTQAKLRGAQRGQYGSILAGVGQFGQGAIGAGNMFGGGGGG